MDLIIISFLSYFLGSIPFGLILTKIVEKKDIRNIGSGNIGATNVLRTGNKILAILTLTLDVGKGFLSVIIAKKFFPEFLQLSCLLVFLGHVFPIWLKFNGGKGVATFVGILIGLSFYYAFLFIGTWLILALIFKYSSISSIFASLTLFLITMIKETALVAIDSSYDQNTNLKLIFFIIFIIIIYAHRKNISNLRKGTESKIKL